MIDVFNSSDEHLPFAAGSADGRSRTAATVNSAREEQEWMQQEKSRLMDDMRRGHLAELGAREPSAPARVAPAGFLPRLAASPVPGGWDKGPEDDWEL